MTKAAEDACGCRFELCFANGYAGEREHLGWHADDSPEIDDGKAHVVGLETFGEPTKARGGFPPLSSPAPELTTP